jgi:CUB domain
MCITVNRKLFSWLQVVVLTFVQFATEVNYDFVQLFDGYDNTSSVIATLTGSLYQTLFYSTQQYMYIRFTSDGSVTSNGFNATYQSVTQSVSTTPTTTTTAGRYTPFRPIMLSFVTCYFLIWQLSIWNTQWIMLQTVFCNSKRASKPAPCNKPRCD